MRREQALAEPAPCWAVCPIIASDHRQLVMAIEAMFISLASRRRTAAGYILLLHGPRVALENENRGYEELTLPRFSNAGEVE